MEMEDKETGSTIVVMGNSPGRISVVRLREIGGIPVVKTGQLLPVQTGTTFTLTGKEMSIVKLIKAGSKEAVAVGHDQKAHPGHPRLDPAITGLI